MKVNIYETVEVSDEDRVNIAKTIDGEGSKKRQATREEIKAFVWENGASWETSLSDLIQELGEEAEEESEDLEDLI